MDVIFTAWMDALRLTCCSSAAWLTGNNEGQQDPLWSLQNQTFLPLLFHAHSRLGDLLWRYCGTRARHNSRLLARGQGRPRGSFSCRVILSHREHDTAPHPLPHSSQYLESPLKHQPCLDTDRAQLYCAKGLHQGYIRAKSGLNQGYIRATSGLNQS